MTEKVIRQDMARRRDSQRMVAGDLNNCSKERRSIEMLKLERDHTTVCAKQDSREHLD